MSNQKDYYGYIVKEEELQSLDSCRGCKSFILEALDPFPGYLKGNKQNFHYFIIDAKGDLDIDEHLIRVTQNISKNHNKEIDSSPCTITIYNKFYKALRLYNHSEDELKEIESLYNLYGITFKKRQQVKAFVSLIKVYKYFELNVIADGVFQSIKNSSYYYLRIPRKISWEDFESIVTKAKEEGEYKHCDFALAVFYVKSGLEDFIRIYSDTCSVDKQKEFQTFLQESIKALTLK